VPIQQAIWQLGDKPTRLTPSSLATEKRLEDLIVADPEILNASWMIIGRQVQTDYRGFIDLLALQPDGTPVIIELKRDKTPREVLAQTLDYASWVEELNPGRLQTIYEKFKGDSANLSSDFSKRYGSDLDEEAMSRDHLMVIVATELDNSTERIVKFLAKRNLNINVLFFQVFESGNGQLLSRAWLVDPAEVQVSVTDGSERDGVWNGEFYVSFGEGDAQRWEDAVNYGFITASGGSWYTQTLNMLSEGDRVWVNVPRQGFVGVGRVSGSPVPASEFIPPNSLHSRRLVEIPNMERYRSSGFDENQAWFVPITWDKTVPLNQAVREVGFFGNQNTVAKPKSAKWEHTVSVLKRRWNI